MRLLGTAPVIGACAVAAVALAGCGTEAGGDPQTGISVVASTNVWGSIAKAVGGDAVEVESLINDAAGDPHAHPDRPSDATALAGADVVVFNGGGYDEFFTNLLDSTGTKAATIDAFSLSGYGEGENEHVWYDLATVGKVAHELADRFGELSPDDKATFAENADTLDGRLDELTTAAEAIGAAHPGAEVVATEPVAAYLLATAGLTDATPPEFSEAVEEETDPPLAAVAATTDLITGHQVVALVNNGQTETSVTNSLAAEAEKAGVPVVEVTETLPEGVTDYVEWMTNQVDALAGALDKT